MRWIILLFALINITNYCYAIKVPGYIVNENSDTIYGTIKLHQFNPITAGFIMNGFDIESLHNNVSFKSNADESYHTFLPATILGFGFTYDSEDYTFKSFLLEYKNISRKGRQKYRFLYLVHKGKVNLYKNVISVNNPPKNFVNDGYLTYYEYFLHNSSKGLSKVEANNRNRTVRDLLQPYNLNEKFLLEIPANTKFKDIKAVLERYDEWLFINSPRVVEL